jgi:hypothetical protein
MSSPKEGTEDTAVKARLGFDFKIVELSRFYSFALGCVLGFVFLLFCYFNMQSTSAARVDALPKGDVHFET